MQNSTLKGLVRHVHTFAFEMCVPWLFAYAVVWPAFVLLNTHTLCPRNWSPFIGHDLEVTRVKKDNHTDGLATRAQPF